MHCLLMSTLTLSQWAPVPPVLLCTMPRWRHVEQLVCCHRISGPSLSHKHSWMHTHHIQRICTAHTCSLRLTGQGSDVGILGLASPRPRVAGAPALGNRGLWFALEHTLMHTHIAQRDCTTHIASNPPPQVLGWSVHESHCLSRRSRTLVEHCIKDTSRVRFALP